MPHPDRSGGGTVSEAIEERARTIKRVTLTGAALNLVLALLKILVGVTGHSEALVADGIHSLSDLLSDAMVWFAAHHAQEAPDEAHPYGHGRFETAATLGLAALLMLVALGIAWDAARHLFAPATLEAPALLTLYVALLSIVSKEWLYHYTRRAARRIRSDMLQANAWHHRSDAVSSIVVVIGIAGTLAGLDYLDEVAAVIVAVMIARIGWDLGAGALRELVDTALEPERIQAMRRTILDVGGVRDIHMFRTRRIGSMAAADIHVMVEPRISVSEGHMISIVVEQRLKREFDEITDVTVHIDPEDDEVTPPSCVGLPLRREAVAILDRYWEGIPEAAEREDLRLHYLNGRIEVELVFPLAAHPRAAAREGLKRALREALAGERRFGRVTLLFKQ